MHTGPGRHEFDAVGEAYRLGHRTRRDGFARSDWYAMPSPAGVLVDIAAGTTSDGRLEIVGVDDHGRLWQRSFQFGPKGQWSDWRRAATPVVPP